MTTHSPLITTTALIIFIIGGGVLIDVGAIYAQDSMTPDNGPNAQAYHNQPNVNRSGQAPVADQAGQDMNDRDIMQKIRKSVVNDDTLSTAAHNIKIIAVNGHVTLKGHVHSEAEKQNIEAKAVDVVGPDKIADHLMIRNSQTSNP